MFASSILSFTSALVSAASSSSSSSLNSDGSSSSSQQDQQQHPFVLAFGNSPLTQRLLLEEIILVGGGLLFPISVVLGLWSIRIAALYNPCPNYIRYDVWNLLIRFIMADLILECLLLPRFQCVVVLPSMADETSSYLYHTTTEWVLQSLGYGGCQRTTTNFSWEEFASSSSPSSSDQPPVFVGTPTAMGIMFAIRLVWMCAGIYVGEGFFPICLTGGIACGKSTVAHYLLHPGFITSEGSTMDNDDDEDEQDASAVDAMSDSHEKESSSTSYSDHHGNNNKNNSKPQRRKSGNHQQHHPSNHQALHSSTNNNKGSNQKKNKPKSATGAGAATATVTTSSSSSPSVEQQEAPASTLYESLTEGSVYLVDTDSIAHDILLPPGDPESTIDPAMSVYDQILQAFGEYDILEDDDEDEVQKEEEEYDRDHNAHKTTTQNDGQPTSALLLGSHRRSRIDRRKLGAIVFADPTKRRTLNQLTHPRIRVVLVQRLLYGLYGSGNDLCVSDVPLLFESGGPLRWIFGLVVLVTCRTPELQLQRLIERNPDLTLEQCQQRIASQMPLEVKEKRSHIVLDNSGSRADLAAAVERARDEMMMRIHGMGISLFQMLLILGGSVPVAVLSKMYTLQSNNGNAR